MFLSLALSSGWICRLHSNPLHPRLSTRLQDKVTFPRSDSPRRGVTRWHLKTESLPLTRYTLTVDTLHVLIMRNATDARPYGGLLNLSCSVAASLATAATKQLQAIVQMWAACTSDVGSLLLCIKCACGFYISIKHILIH